MSHLYHGFHHVGSLRSIQWQRIAQRGFIREAIIKPEIKFLSVGTGFGDELEVFFGGASDAPPDLHITALDIDAAVYDASVRAFARHQNITLNCVQADLLDLARIEGFGHFDMTQAGFVLHDFDYSDKDMATELLSRSVQSGGWVMLSEIFSSETVPDVSEITSIYDKFLAEAADAVSEGQMSRYQWRELMGADDLSTPGLQRTRHEAALGGRDFFESVPQTCERLMRHGLKIDRIATNPYHSNLAVILAKR